MSLSDTQFIEQFEQLTLDPGEFGHRGHLRLAWLYANRYSLDECILKTTTCIDAYACSLGATDKFHHTLTEALVRIIYQRVQANRYPDFEAFCSGNDDLLNNVNGVLSQHYSDHVLSSKLARAQFVPPDRLALEAVAA